MGNVQTNKPFPTKTIIAQLFWRVPMSSKNQTRNLHGNKTKPPSDLSRHYREIGIKAVAAAARNASHRGSRSTNNREKENRIEEETDE
jgi:hypothetical protein